MDNLARRIASLSPEKRKLLELQLKREGMKDVRTPIIPRRRDTDTCVLSFAQQRLWFLDQMNPGTPVYNILSAMRLMGSLNTTALERSLAEIVRRHEILRTTFRAVEGQPMQVIAPVLPVRLRTVELGDLPELEQEAAARQLAMVEAQQPFDLSEGPLLRTTLLRLGTHDHVLLLTLHHIVSDDWSLRVLMRELTVLYNAYTSGKPSPLPDLPIQYADFALWQRKWLQGEVLEGELAYWHQQLKNAPILLDLPTDRPRPPVRTFRGAQQSLVVSRELTERLKALSLKERVTLFMTLLAAFQIVLSRYTWQEDIIVGSPIANRTRAEIEGLIGFFVNMVVLRTDLSGNPSFRELLARVREVALGGYAHQDLPFEKLVEELQPQRNLSHHLLFQVAFALQNPSPPPRLTGLTLSPLEIENGTAKFDLALSMEDTAHGMRGTLEYNTDLFEAATITRMLGHFQTVLAGAVADPEQRLADLPLLTEVERQQLLGTWNATQVTYPRETCLHHLFEAQVVRTPDAVAVACEDEQLTYQELNGRANQLAHHLRALGVGAEVRVGICLERSLEMVVGVLGILKAGGAYLPLDPAYPRERLAFMLADAQVPVLLVRGEREGELPGQTAQVVRLDADWTSLAHESRGNPVSGVTAENLAYVIYTSGSTGKPKGVMVSHRAIVNRLLWGLAACQLSEADRVLQVASFSFDISLWEICGPLLAGAQLVLSRPGGQQDSAYLVKLLAEQRITVAHFVPSLLQVLLAEEGLENCTSLRCVFYGGEGSSADLKERFFARLKVQLQHFYGPTEAAINCTYWVCQPGTDQRSVPIGRPIANTQIYLLDAQLQPVPIGVPGEIYIGGAGLARGYHDRPELTAERFMPHPFSAEPGARLYKTGDLARYRQDGSIEYLGRLDRQVKLRGFRIEPGEIEAVLSQLPGVREAVVLAREDAPGDRRLVAYVTHHQERAPTASELRRSLQEQLPAYMVPASFILLDTLPLTPNGKLDRHALPAPRQLRPELDAAYMKPQTGVEQTIARIWQEVLHLEKVGLYDNFFDLGGHSLLMVQVLSKLQTAFGAGISMLDQFRHPTVNSLARYVMRDKSEPPSFQQGDHLSEKVQAGRNRLRQQFEKRQRGGKE